MGLLIGGAKWALVLCALGALSLSEGYDASLPPWEIQWSENDKAAQRQAGADLAKNLASAQKANASEFTVKPGVYIIEESLRIQYTVNFTVYAGDVQFICTTAGNHFQIFDNVNFALQGPLYLDADPFGFTQAIITGSKDNDYVEIQTMQGYSDPVDKNVSRIQIFANNGTMLPLFQVKPSGVTKVRDSVFRLSFAASFWGDTNATAEELFKIGNLMSIEIATNDITGGIFLKGNNGVNLTQIAIYSKCLLFTQFETGPIFIDHYYGVRRPKTSRLSAGGYPLAGLQGGSWQMQNSELGYNFDDLIDVQSGIYFAFNQTSPIHVYMPYIDGRELRIGDTLHFYNLQTFADDGSARVVEKVKNNDTAIEKAFADTYTVAVRGADAGTLYKITLDRPVKMTSLLDIVDVEEMRSKYMIFENCYMHDSYASGITGKGAQQLIVRNCTVSRAGAGGIGTSVDPYWWEGGIAGNIVIEDNTINSSPYMIGQTGGSIFTGTVSPSQLNAQIRNTIYSNVTISNNTIIDSPGPAIALAYANNVNISGNVIINPVREIVAGLGGSEVLNYASGIYLDQITGKSTVAGNLVVNVDRQNVAEIIQPGFGTDSTLISLCANAVSDTSRRNILARLPNELWTSVLPNSSMVTTTENFAVETFFSSGARVVSNYSVSRSSQHSATTFSFTGTGAQFLSCTGAQYGMARIYLDGGIIQDVDASVSVNGVKANPQAGYCNQLLFETTNLPLTAHNLTVEILQQEGAGSIPKNTDISISSFAYITGKDQCQLSSDPASGYYQAETFLTSAYSRWTAYKQAGLVGPNVTDGIEFTGSKLYASPILLPGIETTVLPLAPDPRLSPYAGPIPEVIPPSQQAGPPAPPPPSPPGQAASG